MAPWRAGDWLRIDDGTTNPELLLYIAKHSITVNHLRD